MKNNIEDERRLLDRTVEKLQREARILLRFFYQLNRIFFYKYILKKV